jgi:hypothetical protein
MYVDYLISGEAVDLMLPAGTDDTPQREEEEEEVTTFTKKQWVTEMR